MLHAIIACRSKNVLFGVKHTHQTAWTPEYKLNSGFCALKTYTFSCMGGIL